MNSTSAVATMTQVMSSSVLTAPTPPCATADPGTTRASANAEVTVRQSLFFICLPSLRTEDARHSRIPGITLDGRCAGLRRRYPDVETLASPTCTGGRNRLRSGDNRLRSGLDLELRALHRQLELRCDPAELTPGALRGGREPVEELVGVQRVVMKEQPSSLDSAGEGERVGESRMAPADVVGVLVVGVLAVVDQQIRVAGEVEARDPLRIEPG